MPCEEKGHIETIDRSNILSNEEEKYLNVHLRTTKEKNRMAIFVLFAGRKGGFNFL